MSRPLLAVLVAAVAFLAIWMVALKPGASSQDAAAPATVPHATQKTATNAILSAPDKARQAVAAANAAGAAHGAPTTPTTSSATPTTPGSSTVSSAPPANAVLAPTVKPTVAPAASAPTQQLDAISAAIKANKVVVILVYNPAGADDTSVYQALAAVPTRGGQVISMAVPVAQFSNYPVVANQVPIATLPTIVIVDRHQKVTTIAGFASPFEIAQRVADAATKR